MIMALKLLKEPKHAGPDKGSRDRLYDVLNGEENTSMHELQDEMDLGNLVSASFSASSAIEMEQARPSSEYFFLCHCMW